MTLQRIQELKTLALSPEASLWTLREAVCVLAVELEEDMKGRAQDRERYVSRLDQLARTIARQVAA